ncbi:hypothetical protein KAM260_21610 [Klebsiella pneumoniae]|nr:hypothetical protein KAM260_21610 [Klebsiella pneumoniae]GKP08400.1 hypothetical protein NUKP2_32910 [Klebsiella quasipneumoniae]GKQ14679.1 hypothetical protein NUKP108_31490 [Klebsiella quasipneumoniae]
MIHMFVHRQYSRIITTATRLGWLNNINGYKSSGGCGQRYCAGAMIDEILKLICVIANTKLLRRDKCG